MSYQFECLGMLEKGDIKTYKNGSDQHHRREIFIIEHGYHYLNVLREAACQKA